MQQKPAPTAAELIELPDGSRRRARIHIPPREIAGLLDLPEGLRVVAVYATVDPPNFVVIVEGLQLDPVDPCVEAPALGGGLTRTVTYADGEKPYSRFGWEALG